VRLSFLDEKLALQDTIRFLTNNGCSEQVAAAYQHAVQSYVFDKLEFDLTRFAPPIKGFYSFTSIWELVTALPANAFDSNHTGGFNCFDAVILLANGQLQSSLHPNDLSGPYLVPKFYTNGPVPIVGTTVMETPRDAYDENYPILMRQTVERLIPEAMRDSRVCLTAALYRQHCVPNSATNENFGVRTLEVLRVAWRRDGLKFPEKCELVMVHGVKSYGVTTEHAGLLIPHNGAYMYVEKVGSRGPFVRLDLEDKSDLMPWLSALWNKCQGHDVHYVTFNDVKIEKRKLIPR
jgi:hypothetical protein